MSNNYQKHILKLIILIKEVTIEAEDGSNLIFEIKTDEETIELADGKYIVNDNRCFVNERAEVQMVSNFDKKLQVYAQNHASIYLHVWLHGEKSVDGYIRYNPFQYGFNEKELNLKLSASLKGAYIIFTTKLELIEKVEAMLTLNEVNMYNQIIRKSRNAQKSSVYTSKKSLVKQFQPEKKPQLKSDDYMLKMKPKKQENTLKQDKIIKKMDSIKSVKSDPKIVVKSPKVYESKVQKANFDYEMQRIKRRLDQERQQKARSISKLKMQINPKIMTGEYLHFQTEVGKLKEKIRNLERKQKHYIVNIEDLGRQLEKGKSKQLELERMKSEMQKNIAEKDIKIRNFQATIRTLNEQIDGLNSRERIFSRKGQVRQTAQKQHHRKLEERLRQTEVQISEVTKERNDKIKQILQIQKKHQQTLKEKDLKISQERSKVFRLKEEIISIQKDFQLKLQQSNESYDILGKISSSHQEKIQELLMTIIKYENEVVQLKDTISKQKQKVIGLEALIEKNQGEQVLSQKKKYHQLNSQHLLLKEKIRKLTSQSEQKQERIKSLEETIKSKSQQNQKHLIRIHNIERELASVREESNRKDIEADYMRNNIINLNEKISTLKQKADAEKNRKQQATYELEKQISFSNKQKDILQNQISDYKWAQLKYNDRIAELQHKIRQLNDQAMKYNEQLMAKDQRIISMEENCKVLKFQYDRISNELQSYTIRMRQNLDNLRTKHIELQDEKKQRMRAEQRYQEERKRNQQYQQSRKSRQLQEQLKQKDKDDQGKTKIQEIHSIQMQLFKRNEQILTLKTTIQLTIRQAELAKIDYESAKSQLNLLQAQLNKIRTQNEQLTSKVEDLSTQLTIANENLSMQVKKHESQKLSQQQYKEAIHKSFSNLAGQFYKDQMNWNIIATTLIPFPDERLSNIQIDLVQKRNIFMVKQKQIVTEQQQRINGLEKQLDEIKDIFEKREEEFKRHETEQMERLKGLLYEGMLEKNNISQQLNSFISQKEELIREIERQKREVIRLQQNDQQLNGQLQLLLMEHEELKNENQQLNSTIFRYKQQEIQLRSTQDHLVIQMQEDHSRAISKLKEELIEKENKIITMEKERNQIEDKAKRVEHDKNAQRQQLQEMSDSFKQAEGKLTLMNSEITTLNNTVKNHERVEAQNKVIIDRLENEIKQYVFKEETTANTINNIQKELMECSIEKQKLNSEVNHLKQRLDETTRIYSQKGQISKEKIQKKMEENSQLKSKNIQQASQLSMKEFYLSQKDQQISNLTKQRQELKEQITSLKAKNKQLIEIKQRQQSKLKQCNRDLERQDYELKRYEQSVSKGNCAIIMMEQELTNMKLLQQSLKEKQKECLKLRQQKSSLQKRLIDQSKKYHESISNLRKEVQSQRKTQVHLKEQHKMKLERAESMNTQKYNILLFEFEKEREEFAKRVQQIEQHNKKIVAQMEARIEVMRDQIGDLRENEKSWHEEVYKRQAQINSLQKKLKLSQSSLEQVRQKYNKYYILCEQLKSQKDHILQDSHDKLSKTLSDTKTSQIRSFNRKLTEIQRKIAKLKNNQELQIRNTEFSKRQVLNIISHIFNQIEDILSNHEIKEESDSFEVYKQKKIYNY